MKRNICLIFAVLLLLTTLTACSPKSELTDALWYAKGSIIGLDSDTGYYDIHLTFNDDNTGNVMNIYKDNDVESYDFEYSAFNGYITILSYDGKVLDKGTHTYPYSIENDVLIIEIDNKKMEFDKLKFTATENLNYEHTYEVLQNEYDRITKYLQLAYSGDMITNIYIDHSESVIVVGLKELSDENVKFFKEYISDADFIEFVEASGVNVFTTELNHN